MDLAKEMDVLMKDSERFTKANFGLQMGSDYPEIVREVLRNENVCMKLTLGLVTDLMQGQKALGDMVKDAGLKDMAARAANEPVIYRRAMEFMYWGIQLGRKMEREQMQVLEKVAAAEEAGA